MKSETIRCKARRCKKQVEYGSAEWTRKWMRTWVEKKNGTGNSYDVCSEICANFVKKEKK